MGGKKDEKNKKNSGGNTRSCAGNWTSRMWGIITRKNRKFGQDKSFDGYFWWGLTGYI